MEPKKPFSKSIIKLENVEKTVKSITEKLKNEVFTILKRQGGVIGISGGIDSSVTLALSARAFGNNRVLGITLPEKDSGKESRLLALDLAKKFGVRVFEENLTSALEGFGCYERRDEAVKRVFPYFDPGHFKMKIGVKKTGLSTGLPPAFSITIIDNNGKEENRLLPVKEYLQIVAASNFKQRSRMSMLYYYAESFHYAVIGTPNKHEVDQGFFVKYGDGGADIMPISHLYKSQVYEIARFLGIPDDIIKRTPTTDTYTAEQTQEEFFYQLPFEQMDLLWYGFENGYLSEEIAPVMGMKTEEVDMIFNNFRRKINTTEYLRMPPIKNF